MFDFFEIPATLASLPTASLVRPPEVQGRIKSGNEKHEISLRGILLDSNPFSAPSCRQRPEHVISGCSSSSRTGLSTHFCPRQCSVGLFGLSTHGQPALSILTGLVK